MVGGCIVDLAARPTSRVEADTSNEAEITLSAGGAARNVAENLARLGCEVTLVTDLGADALGRFLREDLDRHGIAVRAIPRPRSGLYVAVLHADGSLDRGFCQTATETVTVEELDAVLPDLASFDGAVLDANLDEVAVGALAERLREAGVSYALETVAPERSRRVLPALPGCCLLKPDRIEAAALTGLPCTTPDEAEVCAGRLLELGAGAVIVSLGADGLVYRDAGSSRRLAAAPTTLVNVTGAGDALFATAFVGMLLGLGRDEILEAGRRAAALACACPAAVSPQITPALLDRRGAPG